MLCSVNLFILLSNMWDKLTGEGNTVGSLISENAIVLIHFSSQPDNTGQREM